jgi:hypothetical protein
MRGQRLSQAELKQLRKEERPVVLLVLNYYYHTYALLKSHCFMCPDAVLTQKRALLKPDPLTPSLPENAKQATL